VLKERKPVPSFLTSLVEKLSVCQLATGAASRLAITAGIAQNPTSLAFIISFTGAQEVPPNGRHRQPRDDDQPGTITFELTFADLSSPLSVAHLQFTHSKVAIG